MPNLPTTTESSELKLTADPKDPNAFYDRLGDRWVFRSQREYEHKRRIQLIQWLTRQAPLAFL